MKYFFFSGERMASNGAAGRAVVTSTERAEGHEAMDEEQISDEGISSGHGTFVAHTGDVRGHGSAAKQHMSAGKVTVDTLMRRIDTYGLVFPTKAKNVVWCLFRKYDFQKIKEKHAGNDMLKLDQHALCMLFYKNPDPEQRLKATVKLGKDYSPTVMLEHIMRGT
jgi:hypothetical protein